MFDLQNCQIFVYSAVKIISKYVAITILAKLFFSVGDTIILQARKVFFFLISEKLLCAKFILKI